MKVSSHPNNISIPELRAALKGRVITPDDEDYDRVRTVFYGNIDPDLPLSSGWLTTPTFRMSYHSRAIRELNLPYAAADTARRVMA